MGTSTLHTAIDELLTVDPCSLTDAEVHDLVVGVQRRRRGWPRCGRS